LALLVLACGCGGVLTPAKAPKAPPPPHDIPEIPRSFALQQTTLRKVDHLKIRVFDLGKVAARGSRVSSMKSWSARVTLDAPLFVIKHPTQGPIVFDSGLRPDNAVEAAARLAADGIAPDRVRWVILSSVHAQPFRGFTNATTVVDRREWAAAKVADSKGSLAALEPSLKLQLADLSGRPPYGAFDHALDLFGDGTVFVVDLSGHSPGTLGLWVSLDDGPVLLAGDASWILDNHQDLALPEESEIHDISRYWRRLYEMKYMQDALPRLVIFPAYDLTPLKLQPRPDISLAR
jgi:glyoxylase-like metal-dependent hydrolase (beta-lactamase superfamily II)